MERLAHTLGNFLERRRRSKGKSSREDTWVVVLPGVVTTAARGKPFPIPFAKVTGTQGKAISTQRTSSPDMSTLHTQTYIRNDIICLEPPVVAAKATKPSLNLGKEGRRVSGMWYLSSKPSPPLERQPGNEVSVGAVANRPQK